MRPQLIKDSKGKRVQLFATRAKETVVGISGHKFTVMRSELRSALLQEDSTKRRIMEYATSAWDKDDATHYVQLWARVDRRRYHTKTGFHGPNVFSRVPVKFDLPVKYESTLSPAILRIGCTQFLGSHARAFYKWAVAKPARRGAKRG